LDISPFKFNCLFSFSRFLASVSMTEPATKPAMPAPQAKLVPPVAGANNTPAIAPAIFILFSFIQFQSPIVLFDI